MPRWTDEARAKQAAIARQNRPWAHSTGPRTRKGKAICAQNACRHGYRSQGYRDLCAALRAQAEFIRSVRNMLKSSRAQRNSLRGDPEARRLIFLLRASGSPRKEILLQSPGSFADFSGFSTPFQDKTPPRHCAAKSLTAEAQSTQRRFLRGGPETRRKYWELRVSAFNS